MPQRIKIQKLLRLTLVRKGYAVAKHPLLRAGVIEVIKASQRDSSQFGTLSEPMWETPASHEHMARWQKGNWG